jgi:hypothetical protein
MGVVGVNVAILFRGARQSDRIVSNRGLEYGVPISWDSDRPGGTTCWAWSWGEGVFVKVWSH